MIEKNRWKVKTKEGKKGLPLKRSFYHFGIDKKARSNYYTYRGIGILNNRKEGQFHGNNKSNGQYFGSDHQE